MSTDNKEDISGLKSAFERLKAERKDLKRQLRKSKIEPTPVTTKSEQFAREVSELQIRIVKGGARPDVAKAIVAELQPVVDEMREREEKVLDLDKTIERLKIARTLRDGLEQVGVKLPVMAAALAVLTPRCVLRGDNVRIVGKFGETHLARFLANWARQEGSGFVDRSRAAVPKFGETRPDKSSAPNTSFADMVRVLK